MDAPEGNNGLYIFKREAGSWRMHRYVFAEALLRTS
jgi:hypothetical protein